MVPFVTIALGVDMNLKTTTPEALVPQKVAIGCVITINNHKNDVA